MGKLCPITDAKRQSAKGSLRRLRSVNEGPGVRGGLLEDVPLQLNLKGLKKEGVISGEEVENNLDFEAQGKRLFP